MRGTMVKYIMRVVAVFMAVFSAVTLGALRGRVAISPRRAGEFPDMHSMMVRYIVRVMAVFSAVTLGVFLSLNILTAVTDIAPKAIIDLQKSNVIVGALGILLGLTGPTSMVMLWVFMLYHWGTHQFKSRGLKRLWLAALLLGNMLTALVYYLFVFELGRTLQTNQG
jgi:hypothetical protein